MSKETTLKMYLTIKEIETTKNGKKKKFNAYKTKIGNLNMGVKFTKEASELQPEKEGYFTIETDKLSLDTSRDFPVLWVRN